MRLLLPTLSALAATVLLSPAPAALPPPGAREAPVRPSGSPPPPAPRVLVTGAGVLSDTVARDAVGAPPPASTDLDKWATDAVGRVAAAYKERGYAYARAWYRIDHTRLVRIHVDEGRMRVVFTGAGTLSAFFLRVGLNLQNGVYQEQGVERALQDLKRKHDLLTVYHRVKEPGDLEVTPFGEGVLQRVLQIYIVTREFSGWGFDIGASATWGILPGVAYERGPLVWRDDRFRGKIELAFPFRRYLFDEAPQFQWVHGGIQLSYRMPRFWRRRLAPRVDTSLYVSQLDRADLQIKSYYHLRNTSLANLVVFLQPLEVALGMGADVIRVFNMELVPPTDPPAPPDPTIPLDNTTSVRVLARLAAKLEPSSEVTRRDFRSYGALRFDVASSDIQGWLIDTEATGQLFFQHRRHRFLARARGLWIAGDIRFWDDAQLAGDYQRVFFDNRYWVHQAFQLELAYRINVWSDWIDVGIFHDLSVFADRTRPESPVAVADGFGPSLHFLFFDLFAFDTYVGFGFAPEVGFSHTISFTVQTIF